MIIGDPEVLMRQVVRAEWKEGRYGQDGYYLVTLSCGHDTTCSGGMIAAYVVCMECFKRLQNEVA